MWLLAYGPAVLGVLFYRRWAFWRWVVAMFMWQGVAAFLFAGYGTPDHPEGDGLIIRALNRATNNGPEVALVGGGFLVAFYVGVVIFLNGMRLAASRPPAEDDGSPKASKGRKAMELIGLTLLLVTMLYLSPRQAPPPRSNADLGAMLDEVATKLNADLPKRLDDVTTMVRVSRSGLTLSYDYEVTAPRPTDDEFATEVRAAKTPEVCDVQRRGLTEGLSYQYRYVFSSDPRPLSFVVDRAACAQP